MPCSVNDCVKPDLESKSKSGVSLALKNKPKPQGFGEKISKALKGTKQKKKL